MRTLLIYLLVPDDDRRSGGEIASALQFAISHADDPVRWLEVIAAEVVHDSGIRNEEEA